MANEMLALRAELEALQVQQALAQHMATAVELTCKYCFLEHRSDQGTLCPANPDHFLCRDCFTKELSSKISPEFRPNFAVNEARVICRMCIPARRTLLTDGCVARGLNYNAAFALFRKAAAEVA